MNKQKQQNKPLDKMSELHQFNDRTDFLADSLRKVECRRSQPISIWWNTLLVAIYFAVLAWCGCLEHAASIIVAFVAIVVFCVAKHPAQWLWCAYWRFAQQRLHVTMRDHTHRIHRCLCELRADGRRRKRVELVC